MPVNTTGSFKLNIVESDTVNLSLDAVEAVTVVDATPLYVAAKVLPLTGTVNNGLEYTSN